MSYTNKDLDNGMTYSNNRYSLRLLNKLYTTHPHLISHLKYSIVQADPDKDYYYTESFSPKAIKVTINIPEKFCKKISCNSVMAETSCKRDNIATYYGVGDANDFHLQCQPSCFHLKADPVIDEETGEEQVQMMRTEYNDEYGCIFVPTAYIWHERPFYRSEDVYEHRLNDLPTGFNAGPEDVYTYSRLTYEYNKTYCDAYYDNWNASKVTCDKKWWEIVLYAVVGESIVKIVKAGVQSIKNGYKSDYPPTNLPTPPPIEHEWTVLGWKEDIDTSFILPSIDYEIPDGSRRLTVVQREKSHKTSNLETHRGEHVKNLIRSINHRHRQISSKLRRKIEDNYILKLNGEDLNEIKFVKAKNSKSGFNDLTLTSKHTGKESAFLLVIQQVITGLLESIFDPAFWIDVGIGIMSDVILDQMKILFRKFANDIIPKLTTKLLAASTKFFSKVFAKSIISTISSTMSKIVIKTVSKVMIQLTKLAAELASVVGIVLAIITIFDILLTIWDPLGFNNKFDQEIINSVTRSSDIAMRQSLEMATPHMTFELFANMTLSPEEIIDESLNGFFSIYDYLDSLTVNSEGSRIDKGVEMDFEDVDSDELQDGLIVGTKLITPKELYDYEEDHTLRMNFFKASTMVSTSILVICSILLFLEMWVFAIFFFVVGLVIISTTYFNASTINFGKMISDTKIMQMQIV